MLLFCCARRNRRTRLVRKWFGVRCWRATTQDSSRYRLPAIAERHLRLAVRLCCVARIARPPGSVRARVRRLNGHHTSAGAYSVRRFE